MYEHITLKSTEKYEQYPYERSFDHAWSSVLCRSSWIWEEQTSFDELYCPYLRNLKNFPEKFFPVSLEEREDQCIILLQGKHFIGHESILSSKSHKFEAAIRFAKMSSINEDNDSTARTELDLEISPSTLRLLICHIYHGSIVMGLSVDRKVCCEQLIDLYTVKEQEYAKNVRFLAGGDDVGDSGYSTEERLLRIATFRIWWLIGSCVCVSRSHDIST
jgi:hypothetical protein